MEELWLKGNKLISEKDWIKRTASLKSKEEINNKTLAKKILKEKITEAVRKRLPEKKFGIFFSGGVDSGLIAFLSKKLKGKFICYCVGFQEGTKMPEDIIESKKMAKRFGFKLKAKIFNLKEAEKIIKKTAKILKKEKKTDIVNVVNTGVGSVILAAVELGKKDKIDYFLGGLGSEEIFAGYERHVKAKKINQECWKGLKGMWGRDLVRDFSLGKKLKVKFRTPFLDEELIKYSMKIAPELKIKNNFKTLGIPPAHPLVESRRAQEPPTSTGWLARLPARHTPGLQRVVLDKYILRVMAEDFLGKHAWRKKKAAQYGSCFDKALEKLAKKEGFKLKKEWLEKII